MLDYIALFIYVKDRTCLRVKITALIKNTRTLGFVFLIDRAIESWYFEVKPTDKATETIPMYCFLRKEM